MPTRTTIEERLARLEAEVAELKRKAEPIPLKPGWIDKVTASFKDDPEYAEILRLGREIRQADRPPDEPDA